MTRMKFIFENEELLMVMTIVTAVVDCVSSVPGESAIITWGTSRGRAKADIMQTSVVLKNAATCSLY